MAKLPRAVDVPNQPIQHDIGVRVPQGAFDNPLSVVSSELAPGVEKVAQIKQEQESRQDTVDRADKLNRFREEADAELRRLEAEDDLSKSDILSQYGKFLTERQQTLLDEHVGSPDSRVRLIQRMSEVNAQFTGQAAGMSAKIGRDKVEQQFRKQLNPILTEASQNPSIENSARLFRKFDDVINDMKGTFRPTQEEALRQAGREHITLATLEPLLVRGKVESAEAMLIEGGMASYLSPEAQRNIQHRLETIRYNRDKTDNDLTEKEKFRRNLMNRGYSESFAFDMSSGQVNVHGPDQSGDYYIIDAVTGDKKKVGKEDAVVIEHNVTTQKIMQKYPGISLSTAEEMAANGIGFDTEQPIEQPKNQQPTVEKKPSIEEAVKVGTGPMASVKEGMSNILGPFFSNKAFYKNTTDARQRLKLFNQQAKAAFAKNDKFAVAEQEMILAALPDTTKFFKDPDTGISDMGVLRDILIEMKDSKEKQIVGETTSRKKADLKDQITTIDEVLDMMGESPAPNLTTQEEVDKLEPGQRFMFNGKEYIKD